MQYLKMTMDISLTWVSWVAIVLLQAIIHFGIIGPRNRKRQEEQQMEEEPIISSSCNGSNTAAAAAAVAATREMNNSTLLLSALSTNTQDDSIMNQELDDSELECPNSMNSMNSSHVINRAVTVSNIAAFENQTLNKPQDDDDETGDRVLSADVLGAARLLLALSEERNHTQQEGCDQEREWQDTHIINRVEDAGALVVVDFVTGRTASDTDAFVDVETFDADFADIWV